MTNPTQAQIDHINQHLDLFHAHAGSDRTPAEYLYEYAEYKDGKIYERLCDDLGLTPIREEPMNNMIDEQTRLELQLSIGMDDDGGPLSDERRNELQATLDALQNSNTPQNNPVVPANVAPAETDLAALVQAEIAKAMGGASFETPQAAASPQDALIEALGNINPKDSEIALTLLQYLIDTGRLQNIGSINGGGYLWHYAEPKGTTKEGYTPGATKGGRMVDQAVEQAKAAGAKPRNVGMCDKCWSAVEQHDDGSVSLDGDPTATACASGGQHTFNSI